MDFPVRLDGVPQALLPYVAFVTAPLREDQLERASYQLLAKASPRRCMP